jgi:hypothetical protein
MKKSFAYVLLILSLHGLFPGFSSAQSNLQQLLDATKDGETLYIPKNTYVSDNSITLNGRRNLTLLFEEGTQILCSSQFQDVFVIQNCSNIHLFNGTFKHDFSEEDMTCYGSVFYINQSVDIRIHNADISGCGVQGVYADRVKKIELCHCLLHDLSKSAFLFQDSIQQIVLKGNQYDNNGLEGDEIYAFKGYETDLIPYDSIQESEMTQQERTYLDSLARTHQRLFESIRKPLQNPSVSRRDYDAADTTNIDPNTLNSSVFPAWLEVSEEGSKEIWLYPPKSVCRFLCKISGLASFIPSDAWRFSKLDESDFTNITPEVFVKSIQKEEIFLSEFVASGIGWKCDPKLKQLVDSLKKLNPTQITTAQDVVVGELLQVWEKYQVAGLMFQRFQFELVGKCRFSRGNYTNSTESLEAPLFLQFSDIEAPFRDFQVARMSVKIPKRRMENLFFQKEDFSCYFKILVHLGTNRMNLEASDGFVSDWKGPNLYVISDPKMVYLNEKGNDFLFNVYGFIGSMDSDKMESSTLNNKRACRLLGSLADSEMVKEASILKKTTATDLYKTYQKVTYQQLPPDIRKLMKKCQCGEINAKPSSENGYKTNVDLGFSIDLNDDHAPEYVFSCEAPVNSPSVGKIYSFIDGKWQVIDNELFIYKGTTPKSTIKIQETTSEKYHDISVTYPGSRMVTKRYFHGRYHVLYSPQEVIEKIVFTMEYNSKSLTDCYFGIANNAEEMLEGIFSSAQKDSQYVIYGLDSQADADFVKQGLIAKGMHFAKDFSKGQLVFCFTRQTK